jgi:hypothetical protein
LLSVGCAFSGFRTTRPLSDLLAARCAARTGSAFALGVTLRAARIFGSRPPSGRRTSLALPRLLTALPSGPCAGLAGRSSSSALIATRLARARRLPSLAVALGFGAGGLLAPCRLTLTLIAGCGRSGILIGDRILSLGRSLPLACRAFGGATR